MRKAMLSVMLSFMLCLFFGGVFAYSPHYLPGGDNYLSEDNFHLSGGYYTTLEPFLIKPFTEYVIAIPRDYYDNETVGVILDYYDNLEHVDAVLLERGDFLLHASSEVFTCVFTTLSGANYLSVSIRTEYDYFVITTPPLAGFMLEEGAVYDGYEAYVQGTMLDTQAPFFQSSGTVMSYVDTPISITEIRSALQAYDFIDGDLSADIVLIADGYTENKDTLGEYQATFAVTDSSDNSTEITIRIFVVDCVPPVFTPIGTIKAVYPSVYSVEAILGMLSASDNYDGDLSDAIQLDDDNYTANSAQLGIHEMRFSVTDTSGNHSELIVEIEVVDEASPIIQGATHVIVGYDQVLSALAVKAGLSAIDDHDGNLSEAITLIQDDYTANSRILGDHEMRFAVSDSTGNQTIVIVTISVVDEIGPLLYFDMAVIQIYNDMVLSLGDVAMLLRASGEIDPAKDHKLYVSFDSYSRHSFVPGVYHLSLRIEDEAGFSQEKTIAIKVIPRTEAMFLEAVISEETTRPLWTQKHSLMLICGLGALTLVTNLGWAFFLYKKKPLS